MARRINPDRPLTNAEKTARWRESNPERDAESHRRTSRENSAKRAAQAKAWRERNKERVTKYRREYEQRPERQSRKRELYAENPEPSRQRSREWGKNNPDERRRQKHERRARQREAQGTYTVEQIIALLDAQEHRCANPYCRCELTAKNRVIDHKVALKAGGTNSIENLQWLCRHCNSRKTTLPLDEWLAREALLDPSVRVAASDGVGRSLTRKPRQPVERDERGKSTRAVAAGRHMAEVVHAEKTPDGKSALAVRTGKIAAAALHAQVDEQGRSLAGLRWAEEWHAEKDERGKSANAVAAGRKGMASLQAVKDEDGVSHYARLGGQTALARHGDRIRAAARPKMHQKRDAFGRSLAPLKCVHTRDHHGGKVDLGCPFCNPDGYTAHPRPVSGRLV